MPHETADLTLEPQCLLLRGLGKLLLKRVLLSAVSMLLSLMLALAQSHSAAFSRLVDRYCVSLLSLASWTVSIDFLGRFHIRLHSIDSVYNNKLNHIYLF